MPSEKISLLLPHDVLEHVRQAAAAGGETPLVQAIRQRWQRYTRGETVTVQGSAADVLHPYRH